jgi:hypothetical protein
MEINITKLRKDVDSLLHQIKCLFSIAPSATQWTPNHHASTGNKYEVGTLVWYDGWIYKCKVVNNGSNITNPYYWTKTKEGYLLQQEQADWNATGGPSFIRNKPFGFGGAEQDPIFQAWLDDNPFADYLLSDDADELFYPLNANPLGYLTEYIETDPVFEAWLATASTADIADTTDKRYITDGQQAVLVNTSGINSGDDAPNSNSDAYTDSKIVDTISDGVTDKAPSQNAVFDALALKLDSSSYNDRYKGKYTSLVNLQTAHPTSNDGDYAVVDTGIGANAIEYIWDSNEGWVQGNSVGATTTDTLPEGATNLYFTTTRVLNTVLAGLSLVTGTPITAIDSVLTALGKLQKQINDILVNYQVLLVSGTNIKTLNGVSILGAGDLRMKWKSGIDGTSVPNTLTITSTYSQLIPANTIVAGDVLSLAYRWTSPGAKTSATNAYIYINTANNLTGATLLATLLSSTTQRTLQINRRLSVKGATTKVINPLTSVATDDGGSAAMTSASIDWTQNQYILFAIGHTVADQTSFGDFYSMELQ